MIERKFKIIRENGIVVDYEFDDTVDFEYEEVGENKLILHIAEGSTIFDFYNLTTSDIPKEFGFYFFALKEVEKKMFAFGDYILWYGITNIQNNCILRVNLYLGDIIESSPEDFIKISILEKKARKSSEFNIVGGLDLYDFENIVLETKVALNQTFEDCFLTGVEKMNQLYEDSSIFLKYMNDLIVSESIDIDLPQELRTAIKQYLYFFEDYVRKSKGQDIRIIIANTKSGLNVKIRYEDHLSFKKIEDWLKEFINYLFQNSNNLLVNFETGTTNREADLLIASLKNEILHVKNSYEIAKLENKFLKENNEYFKSIIQLLSKKEIIVNNKSIFNGPQDILIDNSKEINTSNQIHFGNSVSFANSKIETSSLLNQNDRKFLQLIYDNTSSNEEREEIVKNLEELRKDNKTSKSYKRSKEIIKKFLDSGISETAKQIVKKLIENGMDFLQ